MPILHLPIDPKKGSVLEVNVKDRSVQALLDTGAESSFISTPLAAELGLTHKESTEVLSPTSDKPESHPVYIADVTIEHPLMDVTWTKCRLIGSEIGQQGYGMLIGRDILAKATLYWDGPSARASLAL